MKIAILGTRGIPNNYGGFEQFAQFISVGLVKKGHEVTVYSPHSHPYGASEFDGVKIIKVFSPENRMGPMANFIYDHYCLKDALSRSFDIIYEAGYATVAFSYIMLKVRCAKPFIVTNMDGIEWKRSKWNFATRKLILLLESISIKYSDYLISDNVNIRQFYLDRYKAETEFIAYGAEVIREISPAPLTAYHVREREFYLLIARLEPENNIEMILDGYIGSGSSFPFIVIGNADTGYGNYLKAKYPDLSIRFIGGVYDKVSLDALRYGSKMYFHGHSVGGTNPSLLEAMGTGALIAAHGNGFNLSVLKSSGLYFQNANEIAEIIVQAENKDSDLHNELRRRAQEIIESEYNWDLIIHRYEEYFNRIISNGLKKNQPA